MLDNWALSAGGTSPSSQRSSAATSQNAANSRERSLGPGIRWSGSNASNGGSRSWHASDVENTRKKKRVHVASRAGKSYAGYTNRLSPKLWPLSK
ncbi:hypothetical protein F444_10815 [Phytophthora nicotianae P1976]|uniref:Uncharacterized protein n=1 Tax=Phytophthora nicotianae P1976 TaxID=1317066 RepID=A0A081A2V2_PHYNI|nr:hypothetical protein F444_10815 [Phytophthora nicotianae P1976]